MTILSFLGGGLWIIPLLTLIGAVIFFIGSLKVRKGGYEKYVKNPDGLTGRWVTTNEKPPFYKSGRFLFSVILFVATIVIVWAMYSDR